MPTQLPTTKSKWQCDECYKVFKLKRDLVEHLKNEFDEVSQREMQILAQLEDMDVNPYE